MKSRNSKELTGGRAFLQSCFLFQEQFRIKILSLRNFLFMNSKILDQQDPKAYSENVQRVYISDTNSLT